MPGDLSPSTLELLQAAEAKLHAASDADATHAADVASLNAAVSKEDASHQAAMAAHQDANQAAQAAITAIKQEFGIQ